MKFFKWLIFSGLILGIILFALLWYAVFSPNIDLKGKQTVYLYIPTGSTFEDVLDSLEKKGIVKNMQTLKFYMKLKKYDRLIKPGRYKIYDKISNYTLTNLLRSGLQTPVKLTFNNIRTKEQLAAKISSVLELDSLTLINALNDNEFLKQYGFDKNNILAMFIPNTYEFYWNVSLESFFKKMKKQYDKFWNAQRLEKAKKIGLKPVEVIILASIVQAEQMQHPDERPKIAGLYLNRLKKGIPLQADPTLIYAIGDFSIKRVYDKMKEIDSPYNTYKYTGLPPGPIITPDISSIDAVLNAEKHDYLYMCAKDDLSGYHYFSKNLSQHLKYAKLYQQKLNQLGIK